MVRCGGLWLLMGDTKDTWKVKTLDEILQEKKRRRELEERTEPKRQKNFAPCPVPQVDDREAKRDTPEEGELRDQRMEITIQNSPYAREDSTEDRKDKSHHHRKEDKRKEKRRHRSHSDEGGQSTTGLFEPMKDAKQPRSKDKDNKERESERRKRQWEEDKVRRDWERQKRREQARAHSRRERVDGGGWEGATRSPDWMTVSPLDHRDRLEQLERQRQQRDRKLREQQQHQKQEQRDFKERERRAEERRKEREARREAPPQQRAPQDEYEDKAKRESHRSRSPSRVVRDRSDQGDARKIALSKEEKPVDKDLLADLQDISGSGSGSEDEEGEEDDASSSQSDEEDDDDENEEEESGSASGRSEGQSAEDISEDERSEEEEEEEEEDGEDMEDEEEDGEAGEADDPTPVSHAASRSPQTPEENYVPDSPPISPPELKKELPKYLPALQGCRSVEEFQCLNRIEEGTYGVVYRAKDKKTDEIVALKRLKMEKEKEGFPITSLREINTILKAQHLNIVTVREIVVGSNMDKIYIVMNYVEHDLKSLMETMKQPFLPGEVKTLMIQLLRGVRHLHDNWILHRDLKTSNLLLSHKGILKIGDFGLAREYGSPLKPYTPVVEYSTAVDMWSVGCIFGELLTQKPLFPGNEKIWPGYGELPAVKKMTFTEYPYNNLRKRFGALLSDQGFDLMNKFLTYCPCKRVLSDEGLKHEYFRETPQPIEPSMFPTWPAKSEQQRVKRGSSPRPPRRPGLQPAGGRRPEGHRLPPDNQQPGGLGRGPRRVLSDEGLKHEYFRETPQPIEPSMFPTWPAKSEQQRVKRGSSPRPPEGGLGYSQLGDDDLKDTGFHLTTSNQGASAVGPGFSLKF
ncbi:hypothetical protein CRUP_008031 [Coryphaenoides rupestris]|nr:hypothetical protein CRUP_008031 [Coryphaenoides rupestris]